LVDRLRADLEHINGWTIWHDIIVMLGTFRVVLHRNAY
jgi:lipopolysaccharide/colanic/teichoic acid biosynthesis glycosyltransferase